MRIPFKASNDRTKDLVHGTTHRARKRESARSGGRDSGRGSSCSTCACS